MKKRNSKVTETLKVLIAIITICLGLLAQTSPPEPAASKPVKIPAVKEFKLKNGLEVAVVERKNVPLVTVTLVVKSYANEEDPELAGLADMTAELLTKGSKMKTATAIAEQMEFLGATLNTGAGRNSSTVSINVMKDKVDQAMAIMSDVILNPSFKQEEIDLLKSQILDGLTYNLTQPGFLANYVASAYSFHKRPLNGTVESINAISRDDILGYHKERYTAASSVLIFTGDISAVQAKALSQKHFGEMRNDNGITEIMESGKLSDMPELASSAREKPVIGSNAPLVKRILVLDLPNSGQAAVTFAKNMEGNGRIFWRNNSTPIKLNANYYPAIVLNSLLGGGYSSRLNQEIRIKRGLSYGAGSGFNWQWDDADFATRTQTKNESAAEVAELVTIELAKLSEESISESELNPRRLVLTGGFGRNLETNQGLASALADLYSFELSPDNLNSYMSSVSSIKSEQIKQFASENFNGGDIIIVGDYAKFKDDLTKRFPNIKVDIIKADELDLTKANFRK